MAASQSSKATLKFVTGNINKLKEATSLLSSTFKVENVALDLKEIQGDPEAIAIEKCQEAARIVGGAVLTEDTCLGFNALGGLPGPYIKFFLTNLKPAGLYKMLEGFEDKSAVAMCIFAYTDGPDCPVHLFKGTVDGEIVEPRGSKDFGWDPCFQPKGHSLTFGEMAPELKNLISHRSIALQKMKRHFEDASEE